jgi:hypothetical protein
VVTNRVPAKRKGSSEEVKRNPHRHPAHKLQVKKIPSPLSGRDGLRASLA